MRGVKVLAALVVIVIAIFGARALPPPPTGLVEAQVFVMPSIGPSAGEVEGEFIDPFAPILIDPSAATASGVVGQMIAFDVPEEDQVLITVATDAPEVVDAYSGDAEFGLPAGATALSTGTATLTITLTDGTSHDVLVTIGE